MASATEQIRCPGCGSQVVADLAGEQVQCPHCGRRELLASKGQVEELDLESLLKLEEDKAGEPLAEFSLVCQSCGAKTAHPAHIKVLECPFCASNVIRDEKDEGSPFSRWEFSPSNVHLKRLPCSFEVGVEGCGSVPRRSSN